MSLSPFPLNHETPCDSPGADQSGWWFGPEIGGEKVSGPVGARRMWGSSQYGPEKWDFGDLDNSQFRLNHRMKHHEAIEKIEVIAGIYPVFHVY